MNVQWLEDTITYTGRELRPHWIAERCGFFADTIVAFRGPCRVETPELVDLEDRAARARIEAAEMLHFLAEFFHNDLNRSILEHRLFIAMFVEELRARLKPEDAARVVRRGNDIFVRDKESLRKLSVGIVTASPVSTLFHFGVNLNESGAPVLAIGLRQFGINEQELATALLARWQQELDSLTKARCKVAPR